MEPENFPLERQLRKQILTARERVYRFGQPTPMERLRLPGCDAEVWVKREDLSAVKSYKWRGACNRMSILSSEEAARGVVTASAGNHAQGVALAAKSLQIQARVYMPRSTPKVKQAAVRQLGGDFVQILLTGDAYEHAVAAARKDEAESGAVYIHAYDDLEVMAGQGTLADEVVLSGHGPFDVAYLQIGGGGMASAVSNWLKTIWPEIEIVGVEGVDQASMKAALEAGHPVPLQNVDLFCDGTAVQQAGKLPFEICRQTIDRIETVTNAQVSAAIRALWEGLRCISEPSGALGVAAVLKNRAACSGKRVLTIVSGANIDFLQLGLIAQSEGAGSVESRTLRIHISEKAGTMLRLLDSCFDGINVSEFQYGKQDTEAAWPIFTLSADSLETLQDIPRRLNSEGYEWQDLTGAVDVAFRVIPLRADLLHAPAFLRLDFYERPGALHDFLGTLVRDRANICYFNYRQTGERIGRALIGLDFENTLERDRFINSIPEQGEGYRSCKPVDEATSRRLLG